VKTLPPEIAALVEAAGGMPKQYDSEMGWRRFHHADLLDMSDEMLEAERILVGIAWAALTRSLWTRADDPTLAWFTERRAAVAAAVERRQRQRRL
jgi:hypothetical protein